MPLKNKEARAKYQREYRLSHLEEYKERERQYRQDNPEKLRERNRKYRDTHREKARVWIQRANKKWRAAHTQYFTKYVADWLKRNPGKREANTAVYRAVKAGKLIRPAACQDCGISCKPHAHHEDYSKKLEVVWLCCPCHKKRDLSRRSREGTV